MKSTEIIVSAAPYYVMLGLPFVAKYLLGIITADEWVILLIWGFGTWVYIGALIIAAMIEGGGK